MATAVTIPKMGQRMTEGTVVTWFKQEGEAVKKGEPLYELMTDKAALEIESPEDGIVARILVAEGTECAIGTPVAIISSEGENVSAVLADLQTQAAGRNEADESGARETIGKVSTESVKAEAAGRAERIAASPKAKRLARQLGVDIARVKGTGLGGRVTDKDVQGYAAAQASTPGEVAVTTPSPAAASSGQPGLQAIPLAGRRKIIAARMAESARTYASVMLSREVDFTRLQQLVGSLRAELEADGLHLTLTDLVVVALTRVLQKHPELNSSLGEQGFSIHGDINIGIAVDTPEGLIVPVIKNAQAMGLRQLVRERTRIVDAARSGRIHLADLEGGTFTVTNLGQFGVDAFSPLINPPETAILGIGRVISRPWVVEGAIAVRQVGYLSLVFDHRVVDGAPAARFLTDMAHFIEEPYRLLA